MTKNRWQQEKYQEAFQVLSYDFYDRLSIMLGNLCSFYKPSTFSFNPIQSSSIMRALIPLVRKDIFYDWIKKSFYLFLLSHAGFRLKVLKSITQEFRVVIYMTVIYWSNKARKVVIDMTVIYWSYKVRHIVMYIILKLDQKDL